MNEFFYTIEEEKTFKKPTIYRLTFTYYKRFLWFKWIYSPEQNYVDEQNLACYKKNAFKTESKEEIEAFKSFCIECDKNA